MIEFLKNWIEQIVISVIIVSIFEMILPNGNLKKYIKIVLGIYVVFSLIAPFVDKNVLYNLQNLKTEDFITKKESSTSINQESMDIRLQKLYIEELENDIKKQVKSLGFETYSCKVDAILKNSDKNAGIKKIDLLIGKEKSGININSINNVEINLTSISDNNKELSNEDIKNLKEKIAEHYEINLDIINIKLK